MTAQALADEFATHRADLTKAKDAANIAADNLASAQRISAAADIAVIRQTEDLAVLAEEVLATFAAAKQERTQ